MKLIITLAVICVILLQTVNADNDKRKLKRYEDIKPSDCPENSHWVPKTSICAYNEQVCNAKDRVACKDNEKQFSFGCYCDEGFCRGPKGCVPKS